MSYPNEYADALRQLKIPTWPELEAKLSSPEADEALRYLQSYLAAHQAHREAWKTFAAGGGHWHLDLAYKLTVKTFDELNAFLI